MTTIEDILSQRDLLKTKKEELSVLQEQYRELKHEDVDARSKVESMTELYIKTINDVNDNMSRGQKDKFQQSLMSLNAQKKNLQTSLDKKSIEFMAKRKEVNTKIVEIRRLEKKIEEDMSNLKF